MLNRAKYEQSSDEVLISEGFALDVQSADPTATEVLACELANRLQGALQAHEALRELVQDRLENLRLEVDNDRPLTKDDITDFLEAVNEAD
jgi:hypothetical protein